MVVRERFIKAAPAVAIVFLAGCAVESNKITGRLSIPATAVPATATAEVTKTFTPFPSATKTATPTSTVTRTETPKPTKTRLLPATTATLSKTEPAKTANGLTNGSELAQDGNFYPVALAPNQWIQLIVTKQGTTDVFIKGDPNRQIEAILQSPQQDNQTSKQGEPMGSRGSPCGGLPGCDTIIQARGPETGKYKLFLHNTRSTFLTISLKAVGGEGGCPPGTHDRNDPGFVESINGGPLVSWPHWCIND